MYVSVECRCLCCVIPHNTQRAFGISACVNLDRVMCLDDVNAGSSGAGRVRVDSGYIVYSGYMLIIYNGG